jgi:hypothetical protein
MRKFSAVPNVTGREMQPRGITDTGPTPENGHDKCRSGFTALSSEPLQEQPAMVLLWGNASSLLVVSPT